MNELKITDFNDEFELVEFINSRKQIPNKKMIEELSKISRQLQQELYQLINNDYQLFINLSLNLVGMDTLIYELKKPLLNLKEEYKSKTREYDERIIHLKSQLMKKNDIKQQKQTLSNYLNIHESFTKIESLLNDNQPARISIEFNQLEYLIKKNTMNAELVGSKNLQLKKKFVDQISVDLNKILVELIDLDSFEDDEKRNSVIGVTGAISTTESSIVPAPAVVSTLGTPTAPEQIDNPELLELFRILVTIDQVTIADKIINQILLAFLQKDPSFESILSLIETRLSSIVHTSMTAFKGCNYNLLQEILKPILNSLMKNKQMFQVVDPKSFHQIYKKSTYFIDKLKPQVDEEIFKEYQKRWQLSVYFQLCHNDIVSDFEKEEEKHTGILFFNLALLNALERLWSEDVYIFSIGHRFWKTTLLLIKRYTSLIEQPKEFEKLNTLYNEIKQVQDRLKEFFGNMAAKLNLVDASLEYTKNVYFGILDDVPVEPIREEIINLMTQQIFGRFSTKVQNIPVNLKSSNKTAEVSPFLTDIFQPVMESEWKSIIIKEILALYTKKGKETLSSFKKTQELVRKMNRKASTDTELNQLLKKTFELDVADIERQAGEAGVAAPLQQSFQKRYYAGPVSVATDKTHITSPPKQQDYYKKDLSNYDDQASRNGAYFLVGSLSFVGAMAAKNLVTGFLYNLSASADVLALSKVEIKMDTIPEGKNIVLKWRGKPVFIRHRTDEEIAEANQVNLDELRHKETDSDRVKDPKWLVMIGVCTHLGCVPVGESGDFGGWFCPCHGSHYDISGRIRKGPAPLNLEIPLYELNEPEGTIVIG
ncbi:hypothetical protein HDV01_000553 [Terramyces sp. JEL0728]|nr:hypothetical protein HDV01_000553 [Terramyces sp. JEL0728]